MRNQLKEGETTRQHSDPAMKYPRENANFLVRQRILVAGSVPSKEQELLFLNADRAAKCLPPEPPNHQISVAVLLRSSYASWFKDPKELRSCKHTLNMMQNARAIHHIKEIIWVEEMMKVHNIRLNFHLVEFGKSFRQLYCDRRNVESKYLSSGPSSAHGVQTDAAPTDQRLLPV